MLKFIWGRGQGPTAERLKLQKELFNFSRNITYGFPHKPSCMGWDPELRLLAVGTKNGQVRVFGKPGVEIIGQLDKEDVGLVGIVWIPGAGRFVTHSSDNSLQLWQIDGSAMSLKDSVSLEGRLKTVSCLCLEKNKKRLLVGTEGGNIYQLALHSFTFEDEIIYQDVLVRNVPENFKLNPGAVEALIEHPGLSSVLVVGYTRGLVLIWDRNTATSLATMVSQQQLESLHWRGESLVTCHNDGSYVVWDAATGEQREPPSTPYGPYPCKAITKIYSTEVTGGDLQTGTGTWNIFSGGMPRASYGDKFTVSVMRTSNEEEQHTVLDLSSKVVDWVVVEEEDRPVNILILSEEELVCVDLSNPTWPSMAAPYMQSIHSSAITAISQVNKVTPSLLTSLQGLSSNPRDCKWPVTGGSYESSAVAGEETLIITGHEDGSVKFWLNTDNILSYLTTFETKLYFRGEDDEDDFEREPDEDDEEEWPPFKKVGQFDPYSDDPRLAVKKLMFSGLDGTLVVGGTAGQVVVATIKEASETATVVCRAETVTEKEGFVWKGHKPLEVKSGAIKAGAGLQPELVLQISPPASVTSLCLSEKWGVLAAGTAHGVVVLDYQFCHVVTARSTLSQQDIANADDNPMSRKKSLKKSLRESFRKLRKGRSQRIKTNKSGEPDTKVEKTSRLESPEPRPMERQIEARGSGSEDGLGSMVRCLHLASTYIASNMNMSPTLWAGTNTGQVLVFLLTITPRDKRKNDKITAVLAKEIQLKHRAPVIDIEVHDAGGLPVSGGQPSYQAPHRVLITSEEQFKLFSLPQLKPCGKYKLTAHEGVRVRKVKSATFTSSKDQDYTENCLIYLANSGEVGVLSLPDLRRQVSTQVIKKEDLMGISSLTFSNTGNGLYLCSSSELQQMSLSARNKIGAGGGRVEVERREEGGDTDSQADRQNQINEREAGRSLKTPREGEGGHDETTVSEVSGDITLDSIRDHMGGRDGDRATPEMVVSSVETSVVERDLGPGRQERIETVSRTVETIEVSSTTTFIPPPQPMQTNGVSA